jgi:hypothetical protein
MRRKEERKKIEVPTDFRQWWEPWGIDKETGASIGGHPDSYRIWARKEPGRYFHRHYGINTESAWMTKYIRVEYDSWLNAGSPQRMDDFVSLAIPIERQKLFWNELRPTISKITKDMHLWMGERKK